MKSKMKYVEEFQLMKLGRKTLLPSGTEDELTNYRVVTAERYILDYALVLESNLYFS
jgi:hypothetical protein